MLISILISTVLAAPQGKFVTQIEGFHEPVHAVWLPDGTIAVADRLADEISVLDASGIRLKTVRTENPMLVTTVPYAGGEFTYELPEYPDWLGNDIRKIGVPCQVEDGWIVPDITEHSIRHYDNDGNFIGKWGVHALLPHEGEGKLHYPNSVDVSDDGKILICEGFEGRIQIFEMGEGDPDPRPLVSNVAHFGKQIDSRGDLILVAEPEMGDLYLLRTGLEVPIELTRFGGEGDAPHQFNWIDGFWLGENEIKVRGDGFIKSFAFEHDPESRMKQRPGMVKFQTAQQFKGNVVQQVGHNYYPLSHSVAFSPDGLSMWSVDAVGEKVVQFSIPDFEVKQIIQGFIEPSGIAIEKNGNVLCSDFGASHIKRFSPEGELIETFGEKGIEYYQMLKPAGITILDDGTIVVVDWGNHRAQSYHRDGSWLSTFGRGRHWTRAKNPPPYSIVSNKGTYRVTFSPSPSEMPLNEVFELTTTIEGGGRIEALRVDAAMPEHGHGMMTDPVTTLQEDGSYKTTGMLLSMPGLWELYFDINNGHTIERAQDSLVLDP
ncbi:MAG: hypothetical protein MK073_07485 [Phycisphaerales bacterium]|nr:hypothetical protein [Phycisphaerales bacterium]